MSDLPTPERCQAIAYRLACYDFPWDVTRALEIALFRTFASPSVAGVLHGTGEFERRPQRRYDDTDLIISVIVEHGFDSDMGRRAIGRMNTIHGRFRIPNEDFLYVLSTFAFEPLRWLDRFGWRSLTPEERLGWFGFWREVGKRMSISGIPDDYAAFEQFNRDYESSRFRRTPATVGVAAATRDMFASWFPRPARSMVGAVIAGLLDEPLRDAFAFPTAGAIGRLTHVAMKARAVALRLLPKRRRPRLRTQMTHRSYPQGWKIEGLGPPESQPRGKNSVGLNQRGLQD